MVSIVCYNCQRMEFWLTNDGSGKLVAQCSHCFAITNLPEQEVNAA